MSDEPEFYNEKTQSGLIQKAYVEPLPAPPVPHCPVDLVGNTTGNKLHTLTEYQRWLQDAGLDWKNPSLAKFRDYLLTRNVERPVTLGSGTVRTKHYKPVTPKTAAGMLSAVRARFKEILASSELDAYLLEFAKYQDAKFSLADCRAFADTVIKRIYADIQPQVSKVTIEKKQDVVDSETGTRLTENEASTLLKSPSLDTLKGIRDTAIIAVLLCTGIRESELCNLKIDDLRQTLDGQLVLHVQKGKGCKTRAVYWGAGAWALGYVDLWLKRAGIDAGYVFRGFHKNSKTPKQVKMSRWAVIRLLEQYPVTMKGEPVTLHPHDLRRTYARRCYDSKMDIIGIQQNLGHADHKTTLKYIGVLNGEQRKPPSLYSQPHSAQLTDLLEL